MQPPSGMPSKHGGGWALSWAMARRYLVGGRSRLLATTTRSALGSTGLGVTAMVVAMALMNGYTESVQEKMLQSGALIVVPVFLGEPAQAASTPEGLIELPGVEAVTYASFAQGALLSSGRPEGLDVYLRGVEPGQGRFGGSREQLAVDANGVAGIVLGSELQRRLKATSGDLLQLAVPDLSRDRLRFQYRSVRVSGTFSTHFSEFDRRYAVMSKDTIDPLVNGSGLYEVAVRDSADIDAVAEQIRVLLGESYLVRDWRHSNPSLFGALRLQKWVLFLVLGLIVVVSTFNVVSTLVVLVREKTRDAGVLASLGLPARDLVRIFLLCGLSIGATAILLGILGGTVASWLLTETRLLRFDPEVAEIYFIDFVPFRVRALDLAAVGAFSLVITLAASWFPARRAAALEPAAAVRYE